MAFDLKAILKMIVTPTTMAAVGGIIGHKKYSEKYGKYLAPAGGAAAGYLIGGMLQHYLNGPAGPTAQPSRQVAGGQLHGLNGARGNGLGEYVDLSAPSPMPRAVPVEAIPREHHNQRAEAFAEETSLRDNGSLGDGSGLGSYTPDVPDEGEIEALLREAEGRGRN